MRGGLAAAPLLIALGLAGPAGAADEVLVSVNGRGTYPVDLSTMPRDIAPPIDTTTLHAGQAPTHDFVGGTSLKVLLEDGLKIPVGIVKRVEVPHTADSGVATVTGDQVANGFFGDPLGGRRDAVVWTNGDSVHFFRPMRMTDDINELDSIDTHIGDEDLRMTVTTSNANPLNVTASADDTTPDPNVPVAFTAGVEPSAPGVTYTYAWDFGDGTAGAGPRPVHPYTSVGHPLAKVTVVGDDGSSGVQTVDLQVGTVPGPKQPSPSPGGQAGAATGSGTGSPGSGGGGAPTGGGAGAKDQNSNGGSRRSQTSETASPKRRRTRPATRTPAKPAAAPRTTTTPARTTPPPPSTPPSGPTGARKARGRPAAASSRATPVTAPAAAVAGRGHPVEGILLASAGSPAAAGGIVGSAQAADQPQARRGGGDSLRIGGWVAGSALLVGLLAAGGLREGGVRLAGRLRGLRS